MREIIFFIIILSPSLAYPQTSILANIEYAKASIEIDDFKPEIRWYIISGEIEHLFREKKLSFISGFAVGFKKEGADIWDGTYLTAKILDSFKLKSNSIILSAGIIYGLAGLKFDQTLLIYDNNRVIGYKSIKMIQSIPIPLTEANESGVIQPVIGFKDRQHFGKFFMEAGINIRLAMYSKVTSNFSTSKYDESLTLLPSIGAGIGLTF